MKVCTRCIMSDESDQTIWFDEKGHCNYCTDQLKRLPSVYFPNAEGQRKLKSLIDESKKNGVGKQYDCLMGLSGGLDSSYLAYLGHKWGLRIKAVHIDDGFDTDISKQNIKKLVKATAIDLETIKPNETQYYELTKAYMRAGVSNLAVPQDNILFAYLYDAARKGKIKYFLSGGNFALECVLQQGNCFNAMDVVNIKDIHQKFGMAPIGQLKFISSYQKYLNSRMGRLYTLQPLNYIDYNRARAYQELKDFCGFEYYGGKHLENTFTMFLQLYWLPLKFNFDKRRSHLSSMIVSGQMTREEALAELEKPIYSESSMQECLHSVQTTLGFSDEEFREILHAPTHQHEEYKTDKIGKTIRKAFFKRF